MKKITFIACMLLGLVTLQLNAQNGQYRVVKNGYDEVKLSYQFDIQDLQQKTMKIEGQEFTQIGFASTTPGGEVGKPELPTMVQFVEIPLCDGIEVNVTRSEYVIYESATLGINNELYPLQPNHSKSEDGPFALVKDAATYTADAFYGQTLARAEVTGVLRNINLGTVYISPIEYNPVTHQIKLYTHIDITVTFNNARIPETVQMKALHRNGVFDGNQSVVINPIQNQNRDELNSAPIKYLIIAHSMFRENEQLINFINWKKRIGYLVEIAYTDDSGVGTTTTSIKNFIVSHYTGATAENPAPSFLLLIGDVAQIPAFDSQCSSGYNDHVTDLYYACWTSGDHIPDCYYGRFSAQNISQLTPQIEKTLMYEQYTMPDPSYLNDAVIVAGTDASHGVSHANAQVNYLANNYINTDYGYANIYKHLYNCSSQASQIRSEIGAGVGYANYTAHCGSSGWSDPSFENSHVSYMNNANKYGLMIGNCCLSGKFDDNACFGETLLRTANKGAVAYIGASNSTYWSSDYYWAIGARSTFGATVYNANHLGAYDRLFHTHGEDHSLWFTTNAGIIMGGDLSEESSSETSIYKLYCWEVYHLFGDPSLKTYLTEPDQMNLNTPSAVAVGTTSLLIQAVPYAYVALTYNNALISAAFADSTGQANLTIPSDLTPGNYELAASAQNYVQFFAPIQFIVPEGPYIISQLSTSEGLNVVAGQSNVFSLALENAGNQTATNINVEVTPSEENIFFDNASCASADLAAGSSNTISAAFTASVAESAEDMSTIDLLLTNNFNGTSTNSTTRITVLAPKIVITDYTVTETSGNNNGKLEPGEDGTVTFTLVNSGHAGISNLNNTLTSYNSLVTVNGGAPTVSIDALNSTQVSFDISISSQADASQRFPMQFACFNEIRQIYHPLFLKLGGSMEDFESGGFTSFNWNNSSSNPWEITTSNVYEGTYCARSKSNLGNSSTSELNITMTVVEESPISYYRKVSSESGYDDFTFSIDNTNKEELNGDVDWGMSSYVVPVGTHTFTFRYAKDYSQSYGSDCAWIDNITFPITGMIATPEHSVLTINSCEFEGISSNFVHKDQEAGIKFTFKNAGTTNATNVVATLSTNNSNININGQGTSCSETYPTIQANDTESKLFSISTVEDFNTVTPVLFNFTLSNGTITLQHPVKLVFLPDHYHTGISNFETGDLKLYPNPSEDFLTIENSKAIETLELIDITGKCISKTNVGGNNCVIDVKNLASGMYFIRIMDDNNQIIVKKFIKK